MDIEKLEQPLPIPSNSMVTLTDMGHIVELQYMAKQNNVNHIQKISKTQYVDLDTGEVKDFNLSLNRSENINSLRQTFKKMRYLINNNFTGASNELFVTLTYRGELQTGDHLKVGKDYDRFLKRLKRYYKDTTIDVFRALEPHASGNYHLHLLIRFNDYKGVYIPNYVVNGVSVDAPLRDVWGNGNVTIKGLSEVDNIGAYLTGYLTDLKMPDDYEGEHILKEVDGELKKFKKNGRLHFYEPGVNIFSKTKGIVYPDRKKTTYSDAKKIVRNATPHYSASIKLKDEKFENLITYEQYNLKR